MTSQRENKVLYITGSETVQLVTDLVVDNFGSPRKHENEFELIVLQIAYVAYKFPNQWIRVNEAQCSINVAAKVKEVFRLFGDFVNNTVITRSCVDADAWEIMVQNPNTRQRSMSGYTRNVVLGNFIP